MTSPVKPAVTKADKTMDAKYRTWGRSRRMDEAVRLSKKGDVSQAEAARLCGVSRTHLSRRLKALREKEAEFDARTVAARAERSADAPRPVEVSGEVRRIQPPDQFMRDYFSAVVCPDCGVPHPIPAFHDEMLGKIVDPQTRRLLVNLAPYHAKVLSFETPVPTPTGWSTIGELRVGDEVFDKDGKVTRVKALSEPKLCRRRVELGDGSVFLTDDDHRWWVENRRHKKQFFTTTAQVAELKNVREYRIPLAGPLDLPEADLPVDPYVLGYWLGDGSCSAANFTAHEDDQPSLIRHLVDAGYAPSSVGQRVNCPGGLLAALCALGVLGNKHVPALYLRGSADQRMALLQGLMDSDGTVNVKAGNVSFTNMNEGLADAVFELVASLGWKPRRHKGDAKLNGVVTGVAHHVSFCPTRDRAPFRLQRKIEKLPLDRSRQLNRPFTSVTAVEPVWGRCIAVESETETFLAGQAMVPTGNSTVGTVYSTLYELCRDPNSRTGIVSKSERLAQRFLYQISKFLTDPAVYDRAPKNLVQDWGPFQHPGDVWSKSEIYVAGRSSAEKDPSVSVYGVGAQIYGYRFDRMVFDDIADLENQKNPDRVAEMLRWTTQECATRVGRHGKLVFMGTRVSSGDIYSFLEKLPAYEVIRYACILDEVEGKMLWEDHFPLRSAVEQRDSMGMAPFQLVYQNVDMPGAGSSFPAEVVARCRDEQRPLGHFEPSWRLVIGLDPAGAGAQAGFTALVMLAVDLVTGQRYILDAVNQRQMKAPQIKDQILDWCARYPVSELRVEVNGLQGQIFQYDEELVRKLTSAGVRVAPHVTHTKNKWDPQFGVESMGPMFYNQQISIPAGDPAAVRAMQPLIDQLTQFPMGQVSDLVMALWFADLGCRDMVKRAQLPAFDERMHVPNRLKRKRHIVDFGSRDVRRPEAGQVYDPLDDGRRDVKLVNMPGGMSVF